MRTEKKEDHLLKIFATFSHPRIQSVNKRLRTSEGMSCINNENSLPSSVPNQGKIIEIMTQFHNIFSKSKTYLAGTSDPTNKRSYRLPSSLKGKRTGFRQYYTHERNRCSICLPNKSFRSLRLGDLSTE